MSARVTARQIRQLTGPAILAGLLSWPGIAPASGGLVAGLAATNPAVLPFVIDGMGLSIAMLGPWHEYATQGLMPDFGESALPPDVTADESAYREFGLMPDFTRGWMMTRNQAFNLKFYQETVNVSPFHGSANRGLSLLTTPGLELERSYIAPGIEKAFGRRSVWEVSAVMAQQTYATRGLGAMQLEGGNARVAETTYGSGLQLGMRSEVAPGLEVGASYQSEIDMNDSQYYRGVFSEPADFDVPASASVGLAVQAAPSAWLTFDVSRIMYSDNQAYTSHLMPTGFLSLLGDGTSPNFAWQDQTVYQFGMKFRSDGGIVWNVGYSTSQNPEPTSESLARALAPAFADEHLIFGVSAPTGRDSTLQFRGALAPSYLFGSDNSALQEPGDQIEVEAVWSKDF